MIINIIYKILVHFDKWRDKRRGIHNVLRNINLDLTHTQKRILISYLDYRRVDNALNGTLPHTNMAEFIQIIKEFINRNFVIDICGHNCIDGFEDISNVKYDYIFGMGEVFRRAVKCNPEAYIIEYFTENPYWFSKQEEKKRNDYYLQRIGKGVALQRTGRYYHENDENLANTIVCMGNPQYFAHCGVPVYRILPSAFYNKCYHQELAKRSLTTFLVFGTEGFIHKGLDLLLEIFSKHLDWTLIVCGKNFKKECEVHGYKISDNIKDYGFIDVDSQKFLKICQECGFIVLPSCSEGASTAVETAMRHGIIPVIMQNMLIEEPETCFITVSNALIETVEKTLKETTQMPKENYQKMSEEVYVYANRTYTLECFTERLHMLLNNIPGIENEDSLS